MIMQCCRSRLWLLCSANAINKCPLRNRNNCNIIICFRLTTNKCNLLMLDKLIKIILKLNYIPSPQLWFVAWDIFVLFRCFTVRFVQFLMWLRLRKVRVLRGDRNSYAITGFAFMLIGNPPSRDFREIITNSREFHLFSSLDKSESSRYKFTLWCFAKPFILASVMMSTHMKKREKGKLNKRKIKQIGYNFTRRWLSFWWS